MNDKNNIIDGYDEFCNTSYEEEEDYYISKKQSIETEAINKYYERNFLDLFEEQIKN